MDVKLTEVLKPGAIILAGGRSSRMGTDKALMRLRPGGPRLVEMILAAVGPLMEGVIISSNRPDDYAWTGLRVVADNFQDCGPLAGLEAGLTASRLEYNLVVACDMPWLEPALLAFLLSQAGGYQAVVPLNERGRAEPLCAVYSRECLPAIRRNLTEKSLKMSGWLGDVKTLFVPAQKLAEFDRELRSFRNLNRPEDLPVMIMNKNWRIKLAIEDNA